MRVRRLQSASRFIFCCALLIFAGTAARAQDAVPAVLLADVHFDPFHNPRLLPALRAAPVERWPAILAEGNGDGGNGLKADADLAALEVACRSPRLDTNWFLFRESLRAAHEAEPHPAFVTLGGDLLTHQFPCRFRKLVPGASEAELSAFSAKTVAFVGMELRLAFPQVPVYIALGNNDSGCADYRETAGSGFMRSATETMTEAAGLHAGRGGRTGPRRAAATPPMEVSPEGDYNVALPAPLQAGRLIVLQDIFEAAWYGPCGDPQYSRTQEHEQIQWLRGQLQSARAGHQQVWVMGHIPPGVDVYGSFTKYVLHPSELCSAEVHTLLADTALVDTLLDFADVVRLGLFAHTHMDEMRLLRRTAGPTVESGKGGEGTAAVPIKIVPSITSYYGNHPAFLVAAIDPRTMVLKDWRTVVSPEAGGAAPPWTAAYQFSSAYQLPNFSAVSAAVLADGFTADHDGKAGRSTFFRDHFYAGGGGLYGLGLAQIWPAYACAVRESRPEAFRECLCPAGAK